MSRKRRKFEVPRLKNMEQVDLAKINDSDEESGDIERHFTADEYASMPEYERSRYRNIKRNYQAMTKLGLNPKQPAFMAEHKKQRKTLPEQVSTRQSDGQSDEEWTPNTAEEGQHHVFKSPVMRTANTKTAAKRINSSQTRGIGLKKSRTIHDISEREVCEGIAPRSSIVKTHEDQDTNEGLCGDTPNGSPSDEAVKKKTKNSKKQPGGEAPPLRYPKRNIPRKNYAELEIPDEDSFIHCEQCNLEYKGDCPEHGLVVIKDKKVPLKPDKQSRAIETTPDCLSVCQSKIKGAGFGVWAEEFIPRGVRFGPYEGTIVYDEKEAQASGYGWQIFKEGKPSHFVDAQDSSKSNWMRYVNCARNELEQNLVAFQYLGQIYYRTFKAVLKSTELMVWYGKDYASELGIAEDKSQDLSLPGKLGASVMQCYDCGKLMATHQQYFQHSSFCIKQSAGVKKAIKQNRQQSSLDSQQLQLNTVMSVKNKQQYTLKRLNHTTRFGYPLLSHKNINSDEGTYDQRGRKDTGQLEKAYECQECDAVFQSPEILVIHGRAHGDGMKPTCAVSNMSCTSINSKSVNKNKHTGEKPYKCDVCEARFAKSSDLTKHQRIHTGAKPYKCDMCEARFAQLNNLTRHQRIHTGAKPYKCDVCEARFTQLNNLTSHQRIHTGAKPYKCDVCEARFAQSSDLTKHQRIHTGAKPYKCDVCEARFTESGHLTRHQRIHTGAKPYKCDVCEARFIESGHLTRHQRIHTGAKPYKCDVCEARFAQSGPLTRHQRIHTGEKPYKCDVCEARFTQSSDLTRHQRIHTGEKPYKCDVCEARFAKSCNLTRHQRIHTGAKPYKCDVCEARFAQSSDLTSHQRIHTGAKPYKCDVCEARFAQSSDLTSHQRIHTGAKPYKCDVCEARFAQSGHLTKHQRIHTGAKFIHSNSLTNHQRIHT